MATPSIREFFAPTIERVVGPYMSANGFAQRAMSEHRIVYARGLSSVWIGYYPEDLPLPWIAIDVGRRTPDGAELLVALWRSIPDLDPLRDYTRWRFQTPQELEVVARRIVKKLLSAYGPRLWDDGHLFSRLLSLQVAEANDAYDKGSQRSAVLAGRRAFDNGEYQKAVDEYEHVELHQLAAEDRTRLRRARSKLGSRDTGRM